MLSSKRVQEAKKSAFIEKYNLTIIREIGSGSFGKVFLCEYSNSLCALKRIKYSKENSDQTYKSVLTEFNILSKCKHPRIVKFIEFFNSTSNWNFIFEYMELGSLRNILNYHEGNHSIIPQNVLSCYFMDIVFGLRHLHLANITHRDLKPENILVDKQHRLKIADFGISSLLENSSIMNQTCVGTIRYMAPEVYLHKPYTISCDIWALGIILYEMAMLSYPFNNAQRARIINTRLEFIQPEINCAARGYSDCIQDLSDRMIVREPDRRATIKQIVQGYFPKLKTKLLREELEFTMEDIKGLKLRYLQLEKDARCLH
ncbi:unnamed protein product [Diamesa tonsa]